MDIRGIILNGMPQANFSLAELTNPRIVQDLTGLPVLGVIPKLADVDVERMMYGSLKKTFAEKVAVDGILT